MLDDWDSEPLSNFISLRTYGFTNPMPTTEHGPYMVTAKDIHDGKIDYESARHTSIEAFNNRLTDKSRPRIGDVLLTKDGSIGRVAVCDREDLCINQSVALLRPNSRLLPPFLTYLLQAPVYQRRMENDSDGSTIKHIYITRVDKMPISVPALYEQEAIVEVLGALDDKIAANTNLVKRADELAGALTERALDPSGKSPLTALAELTMGSSPSGTSYNDAGEGTVFYQGIRDFGVRYPENRVWTTSPARMARRRDTLLSVRAPVGRLNLAAEDTCIGRGLASLRSLNGTPFTLFHVLKDAPGIWAPFEAEGTVFGSINKKQLESLEIANIPMQLREQLETELAVLEATIESAIVEKSSLTRTRDTLLPQLMSAKLRIKDAEDLVSAIV